MRYCCLLLFIIIHSLSLQSAVSDSLILNIEKAIDDYEPSLPHTDIYFDLKISDISICKGPGKVYYVTGTRANSEGVQQGIAVWASRDLKQWNLVGNQDGYVWTFAKNANEVQKKVLIVDGIDKRAILSPKIYYLYNTFWITYTLSNTKQSGLLKSTSGRAQGPYINVEGNGLPVYGMNASLFFDTDSSVYFIWGKGYVQKMLPDMSGFNHNGIKTLPIPGIMSDKMVSISVFNHQNKYYVSTTRKSPEVQNINERMPVSNTESVVYITNSLWGNYSRRFTLPHGGNGMILQDFQKKFWFVYAANQSGNPMANAQAFIPLTETETDELVLHYKQTFYPENQKQIIYVSPSGNDGNGNSWNNAYTSIQRAVDKARNGTQIWIAAGTYDGSIDINFKEGIYLMGGFKGDETELRQRNSRANKTIIHGHNKVNNVVIIRASSYVRLDGLTIAGGNASGGSNFQQYGAGLHILGGGQTVRIVNCSFEKNMANYDGGALYASIGASPLILNCNFSNNTARNNGGAIAVYSNIPGGYNVRIYNCSFNNNYSYGNGSAVYYNSNIFNAGILTMRNCLLINNNSGGQNGLIAFDGTPDFLLANSTVCFNTGTALGAVIGNPGNVPGKARVINSIFHNNTGATLFSIEGEAQKADTNNRNIWIKFQHCNFNNNQCLSLVRRNFDGKSWDNIESINQSPIGLNCNNYNPGFADSEKGNFSLKGASLLRGKGSSQFYFPYNISGNKQNARYINQGCY